MYVPRYVKMLSLAWGYGWQERLNTWQLIHSLCVCHFPLWLNIFLKILLICIHNLFLKQKQGLKLFISQKRKLSYELNALSPAKLSPLSQMFYRFTYFLILCFLLAYFFLCSLSVTVLLTVKTEGFRTAIMPPASCKTLRHINNFCCTLNNAQFITDHL